jgi:hypothetical protein
MRSLCEMHEISHNALFLRQSVRFSLEITKWISVNLVPRIYTNTCRENLIFISQILGV